MVEKEIFLSGKVILMTTHMSPSPRQFATLVAVIFILTPVSLEASIMSQLGKLRALFGNRGVPAQTVPSAPTVPVPQPVAAEPAPAPPLPRLRRPRFILILVCSGRCKSRSISLSLLRDVT